MRKSSSLFFYFDVQIYKNFRNTKRFVTFFFQNFSQHVIGHANNGSSIIVSDRRGFESRPLLQRTGVEKGAVII